MPPYITVCTTIIQKAQCVTTWLWTRPYDLLFCYIRSYKSANYLAWFYLIIIDCNVWYSSSCDMVAIITNLSPPPQEKKEIVSLGVRQYFCITICYLVCVITSIVMIMTVNHYNNVFATTALINTSSIYMAYFSPDMLTYFKDLTNRKWQDYVYIQCEYKSTKQKIKHLLREENKVKENKIS